MYKDLEEGQKYQIRWIEDFRHIKKKESNDYFIKGEFLCETLNQLNDYKSKTIDINLLFDKPIGTQIIFKNGRIGVDKSNIELNPNYYITDVLEDALGTMSTRIYYLLGLKNGKEVTTYSKELKEAICSPLSIQNEKSFLFSNGHLIKNTGEGEFDMLIIPSFEIFRHFFLRGSKLSRLLLSYLISKQEYSSMRNDNLFLHTNNSQRPYKDNDGKRVANLCLVENFSDSEKKAIFRMAFIEKASDCINTVRDSIFDNFEENSPKLKNPIYHKIETFIPQDKPFKMAVSGKVFEWRDVRYLMVSQILDTKEVFPYDKIQFSLLTDYSHNIGSYSNSSKENGVRNITKPSKNALVTEQELGNKDEKGILDLSILTIAEFENDEIEIERISKEEQGRKYGASSINHIEQQVVSLTEGIGSNSKVGRANTVHNEKIDLQAQNRTIFINALKQIKEYSFRFLDMDSFPAKFIDKVHINLKCHNIVFCEVVNENGQYCYIVRLDDGELCTTRYGIYKMPNLENIAPTKAYTTADKFFKKYRLSILESYHGLFYYFSNEIIRGNQGQYNSATLSKKIRNKIDILFRES